MDDDSALRTRLRALAVFGDDRPPFVPDAAPDDPRILFLSWLDAAIEQSLAMPHAAILATASAAGDVSARTLIIKDVDDRGWWFATRTDGTKARELAENPRAALTFLWREHGRQVRVEGIVTDAGAAAGAADFLARPVHSRAAAMLGVQSEPLESRARYVTEFAAAKAHIECGGSEAAARWAAMILQPLRVEFWASTPSDGQIRLEYRRAALDEPWRRGLLWP